VVENLAAVRNGSNQVTKVEKPLKTPNKFLDFLSTSGKLSVFLLAITPLPTYIGVWGKTKSE
jgi:hypothetical protein